MTDTEKLKIQQTIFYYCAFFAIGLVAASIGPALGTLASNTGVTLCTAGLIFTMNSTGFLVGSFIGGEIFNRFSGNPFIALSLITISIAAWLIPLCSNFYALLSIIFIHGIAVSILIVGTNTLIVLIHKSKLDMWMNGMHLCFGIGALLSPMAVTYVLLKYGNIVNAYRLFAILILVSGIYGLTIKSPVFKCETIQYKKEVPWSSIIFFGMLLFLYVGSEVSFAGWIYSYVLAIHNSAKEFAGIITSSFWIAFTVGRLISVPLSSRLTAFQILLINYAGSVCGLILVYYSQSLYLIASGTILFGLSMSSTFPSLLNYASKTINLDSRTNGILFALGSVGAMIIPYTTGYLFETISYKFIIYSIFIPQFIGLLLIASTRKKYNS